HAPAIIITLGSHESSPSVSSPDVFFGLRISKEHDHYLLAYLDSDWVGDPLDQTSRTGYFVYLGSSPISWFSKKQRFISRSLTEVEYRMYSRDTLSTKFYGHNYPIRKFHFKDFIRGKGLLGILDGSKVVPTKEKEKEVWEADNGKITWLVNSVAVDISMDLTSFEKA
uniref:Retrovirus-related Pol polyprotein from transposon TNT 1-94 n=1 Tax=Solanum lycopersicum TaxID=4081 RepID=A0A3Q7GK83_SOLLC